MDPDPQVLTNPMSPERTSSHIGRRIVFLDALRFIAAAAVVFQHTVERQGQWGAYVAAMLSPGVFGVVLFFIVSGFVIPMSVRGRFDVKTFVIRRIFRIYPLILVTFLLLAVIGYGTAIPAFGYVRTASARDWIANLLLVQDYTGAQSLWGVTWTLSLEVAWYAVFAISLLRLGRNFDDRLSIAAPAILLTLALVSVLAGHRLPLGRPGMIYAAVLGCRIYRNQTGEVGFKRLLADVGVFIIVVSICNIVAFGHFKHPNITMSQALYPWIAAPILFVSVTLVPAIRHSRLVNSVLVSWLGTISFSTYLLHPFAIGFAETFAPAADVLVVAVALTIVLSAIGYRLVEVPGQMLGRRFINDRPRRAQDAMSVTSRAV